MSLILVVIWWYVPDVGNFSGLIVFDVGSFAFPDVVFASYSASLRWPSSLLRNWGWSRQSWLYVSTCWWHWIWQPGCDDCPTANTDLYGWVFYTQLWRVSYQALVALKYPKMEWTHELFLLLLWIWCVGPFFWYVQGTCLSLMILNKLPDNILAPCGTTPVRNMTVHNTETTHDTNISHTNNWHIPSANTQHGSATS